MVEYANNSRTPHSFNVDDDIWLSIKNISLEDGNVIRKLNPKFCGPLRITKKINDVSFRLELPYPRMEKWIHYSFQYSLLKPLVPDKFNRCQEPLPPKQIGEHTREYEIEKILDSKLIRRNPHFLVNWEGYGDHENEWQTKKNTSSIPKIS